MACPAISVGGARPVAAVVAVVLMLAGAPSPAQAQPMDTPAATSVAIAAAFWGAPAPCGTPVVRFAPSPRPDYKAWADVPGCGIYISESRNPADASLGPWWMKTNEWMWSLLCDTIVHEYGHLLGFGHDAPVVVMHHMRTSVVQQCLDTFLPPPPWAREGKARRRYQYDPGAAWVRHQRELRVQRRRAGTTKSAPRR